jgi:hypothetical protein
MSTAPLADAVEPALLDVRAVARMLECSWRHVYRIAGVGRPPRPIRLSSLVSYRRCDIDLRLADGCPRVRKAQRR